MILNMIFYRDEWSCALAPAGIVFGERGEVQQGRTCKRGRRGVGSGGPRNPRMPEKCSKNLEKIQRKIYKFLKKFSRKNRDFFKIFLNFYRTLDKNLENLEICICRGSGAEPPGAREFMEI